MTTPGALLRIVTPLLLAQPAVVSVHHRFQGPRIDYVGVGAAALLGWVGVPGVGEAAVIAAGVLAAHHKLDLFEVVLVAWGGAAAGGVAGWLIGLHGGRRVITAPGPLRRWRLRAVRSGEHFFGRYGTVAVFFVPAWAAGLHRMHWTRYLPANALAALVWALLIGVGAYAVGPSIADVATDLGLAGLAVVAAIVLAGVVRSRRRRGR